MSDFAPGQQIRCTVKDLPAAKGGRETILRLMRQDPQINKALRRSQQERARTMPFHQRGGRRWFIRPRPGKIAKLERGESGTMGCVPHLAPDLKSVESYLEIEAA